MSHPNITPDVVFKDQSLSDILAWAHYVKYHDVYYVDDKNIIITYLDPTTYSAYAIYELCNNKVTNFRSDYVTHLKNMGYHCVYLTNQSDTLATELRTVITLGHMHDMFHNTEFTHRVLL